MMSRPSLSTSLMVALASLLLLNCGGSSNSQPSEAKAPVFTSTAPLDASEGQQYIYSVSATDPAGRSVTFSLTKAPFGASLSSNTLSWTPQSEQSRKPNAFEITATNDQGVSARQNWSVSPTGTVYARFSATYIHADGTQEELPREDAAPSIFFPSENLGGAPGIPPNSVADGVATYRNIPAGHFYVWRSARSALWTDKSSIDLRTIAYGRPAEENSATASITAVTGIRSQGEINWLEFHAPNVRASGELQNWLMENPIHDWRGSVVVPFDSGKDDSLYILERAGDRSQGFQKRLVAAAKLSEAADNELKGTLLPVTEDLSLRLNVGSFAWKSALNSVHNGSSLFREFQAGVYADPLPLKPYTYPGGQPVVTFDYLGRELGTLPADNLDFGRTYFGNPFPSSWPPEFTFLGRADGRYSHAGAEIATMTGEIGFTVATLPGESDVLAPLVQPVTSITVDGKNAMAQEFTITTTVPTISWAPPAGAPRIAGYVVSVCALEQSGAFWNCTGDSSIYTTETSVKLTVPIATVGAPPQVNIVSVRVIIDPEADFGTKPFFRRPTAWADAFTKVFYLMN